MADTKLDILINAAVNGVDQIKSLSKEITDVNSNVAQTAQASTVAGSFFDTLSQAAKELGTSLTGATESTSKQADATASASSLLPILTSNLTKNVAQIDAQKTAFDVLGSVVDKYKGQILLATTALAGYLTIEGTIASANAAKEYNKLGNDLYEVALASGITKDKLKEYENELMKTGLTSTQAREQLKGFIESQLESGYAVDNFGESILESAKNVEKNFDTLEALETHYEDLRKTQGDSIALTKEYEKDLLTFNRALLSDFESVEQKQERIKAVQSELLANIGQTFLPMKNAIDKSYKSSLDIIANFLIEVNKVVEEFDKQGEFANILGSMFKESSVILQGVSDVLLGVIRYVGDAGNEFVTMAKTINRAFGEIKEFASNSFGFIKESVVDLSISIIDVFSNSFSLAKEPANDLFNSISANLNQSSISIDGFSTSLSTSFDSNNIQSFLLNLKELIPSFEELNLFAESFYDVAISAIEQAGTSIREYGEEISGTGKEIESLVEPIKDVANALTKANSFTQWIRDAIAFIKPVTDVVYSLDGLDKELASIQGQLDGTSKALTVAANTAKPVASEMQNLGNFLQFLGGGLENTSENISYLSKNFGLASDSLGEFEKDLKELASLSGFANDLIVRLKEAMVFSNEETVLAKLNNDLKTILDSDAVQSFIFDFTSGFTAISEKFNGFLSEISEFSSNLTGFFGDLIDKTSVLSESFKFVSENGSLLGGVFYTIGFAVNGLKDGFDVIISSLAMFGSKVLYTFSFVLDGVAKAVRVFSEEKANYLNRSADDLRAFSEKATQSATQVFEKIADGKGALQDYVNGIDDAATAMSKVNPSFNKLEENIANVANMWQSGTLSADDFQGKLDELTESVEKAGKESKISESEMKKLTDSISKIESTETDRFNNAMEGMKVSIREVATTAEDGENKIVEFLDTTGLSATKNGKVIKDALGQFSDNLETIAVAAKGTEKIFNQAFSKGLDISKTILDLAKFNGALEQAQNRGFEVGQSLELLRGRFYGLLDNTLKTAKTTEDFEQVRVALTNMRNTGVISAADLTNAQEKLRAKIKEVADETKNADISSALKELGTSYQEFSTGISDAAAKRSAATQQLIRGLAEKTKAEIEAKEATEESTESEEEATESEEEKAEAIEKTTEIINKKSIAVDNLNETLSELSDNTALEEIVDNAEEGVKSLEKQVATTKELTNENERLAAIQKIIKDNKPNVEQATGGTLAGQSEYNNGAPDWAKRLLEINEQVKSGKSVVNEVAGTTEFVGGDQGARLTQLDNEFKAIAKARKEADALYEILNKEINTAKTLEELGNVNNQILEAKESGTLFGEALTGALQQVTLKFDSLLESQLKNAKTKEDYDILTRKVQELGSTGTITGQQMSLAFDKIKEKQTGAREETLRNSQQLTELASASARLNSATIASRKAEIDVEKAKQTVIAAEEKVRKNGTEASKAELAVAKANLELAEERGRLSAIKYREELANMDLVKAKQVQINAEKARALNPADVNLNAAVDAANREVEARQLVVENIKQAVIAQEQLVAQTELGVAEAQQLAAANAEAAGAAKSEQPAQGGGGGGGGSFVYTTRTSFQKQMEEITGQKDTGQYEQIFQGSANKDGGFWNIGEGAARQALAVKTLEEVKQKTEENKKAAEEMATAYEKSKGEINQAKDGVSLLTENQAAALGLSKEMADSYNKIRQDAMNLYKESEESFKSFSKSMVDIANESSDQERSQIDLIKEKTEQRKQDLALSKQELDLKLQLALVSAKAAGLTDQESAISKMMQKTNDQYAQALGNLDKIAAKEIEVGKNKEFIERDKLQGEIDAREFERAKKKNEEKEKLEKAHIEDVRKREDQLLDEQSKKLATVQKERMDKELAMRTSILDMERQERKDIENQVRDSEDKAFIALKNRIDLEKSSRLELLALDKQRSLQDLDVYEKKRRIELEERRNEIESRSALLLSQATSERERIKIESDKKAALLDLDKKGVELSEAAIDRKKTAEEKARAAELVEKEKQAAEEKSLADQKAAIELQRQKRAKRELETQRIEALQFEDAKRKLEKLKQDEDLAFQKQKDVLLEQRRKNDLEFEQKKQSAQRAFDAEREYRALKLKALESGVNLGTIEDIKKSAGGDLSKMVESGDSKASEAYFDKLYKIQELIDQKMMSKLQSYSPPKAEMEKAATRGETNLGSFVKGDVMELNLNLGGQRITTYAPKEQSSGNLMDSLQQFKLQTT